MFRHTARHDPFPPATGLLTVFIDMPRIVAVTVGTRNRSRLKTLWRQRRGRGVRMLARAASRALPSISAASTYDVPATYKRKIDAPFAPSLLISSVNRFSRFPPVCEISRQGKRYGQPPGDRDPIFETGPIIF
ncbi:hypothetical protein OVY01_14235 [Robbsia sp. Bb-Pol-6]|uniref:Uncharacterized protein n=1 Tax=Robbsia betulipollinis TaxID=2981849 RepID=A0ABT3ZP97_9BURK|nr:hypothetical protein [Robbsia betulipollinis]MCY0388373.1 hypothetical protein [Robbsia betulipollinis]